MQIAGFPWGAILTSFKPLMRRIVFGAVEKCWEWGFSLSGRFSPRPPLLSFSGNQRVVIVAPHPDDETIGVGGTAVMHRQQGDDVSAIVLTDGRQSHAANLSPDEMAAKRALEIQAAADILGIKLVHFQMPEGSWNENEVEKKLAPYLAAADVIYAPSCIDFHPEHIKTAVVVARLTVSGQIVRIFELGVPLSQTLVNCCSNVSDVITVKKKALAAFKTQAGAIYPLQRMSQYRARYYRMNAVELFRELDGADYRKFISSGDWRQEKTPPFYGVRYRPFSDPLAYWIGQKRRRHLRSFITPKTS